MDERFYLGFVVIVHWMVVPRVVFPSATVYAHLVVVMVVEGEPLVSLDLLPLVFSPAIAYLVVVVSYLANNLPLTRTLAIYNNIPDGSKFLAISLYVAASADGIIPTSRG